MAKGLRQHLREATQATHLQVEAAFAQLDIAERGGLDATLRAHDQAISRLLPSLSAIPDMHDEAIRLRQLVRQSLAALDSDAVAGDVVASDAVASDAVSLHPLAAAYVLLGSRLGSRVISAGLRQRGANVDEGQFAYFTDDNSRDQWKSLLRLLDLTEDSIDQVTADTIGAFDVFAFEARHAAQTMKESSQCRST